MSVDEINRFLDRPRKVSSRDTLPDWERFRRARQEKKRRVRGAEDAQTQSATPNDSGGQERPVIRVTQGELHNLVQTSQALLANGSSRLFQYGGALARVERVTKTLVEKDGRTVPEGTIVLEPAGKEWVQIELCRLASWERAIVGQGGCDEWVSCDPPMKVASGVLADRGGWQVPLLTGLTEVPILRPDGSVFDQPGYDEISGLFFDPSGLVFPPIPERPSRDHVIMALARLEELLKDFPFVQPCHKSAALAMLLTAIQRRQLKRAPGFAVSAREAGTGKGLLVDVVAILATGRTSPITPYTKNEDEQRKRITASLLAGHPIINIDNVTEPIDSAALAALLTSEIWTERILGISKNAEVPSNALVVMTGNNLLIQGDMTRRVIPIELDAQCERPELRTFDRDLLAWVTENRPSLVAAALTVLSAWRQAGRPVPPEFQSLGSYEAWSREIAACLVWLDRADPTFAMERIRKDDPKRALLRRILASWHACFGNDEQTIGAVMQHVEPSGGSQHHEKAEMAELWESILEATPDARNDQARRVKLGLFLKNNAGRVVSIAREGRPPLNLRFIEGATFHRAVRWRVGEV
jgi:putative DNA primase/helicase